MFSGIIEQLGIVSEIEPGPQSRKIRLDVGSLADDLRPGDSVAVDGACLTAETVGPGSFTMTAVSATLERTIAGDYAVGTPVNIERALRADGRLDGHLVQGHVDGVGALVSRTVDGDAHLLRFRLPLDVARATVEHGSIAVNGVSLTVSRLLDPAEIEVAVIPFTRAHTNLGTMEVGARVNVEGDLIGKYVGRMLAPHLPRS